MTTKQLTAYGTIMEMGKKNGKSSHGEWTLWRLRIEHEDGSGTFWYSIFGDEGGKHSTGETVDIAYTTKENKNNPEFPYRTINLMRKKFTDGIGPGSTETVDTRLDAPESSPPPPNRSYADARQMRIEWQSARRDAISLMAAYPDAFVTDDYIGEVFSLAQRLYDSGPNGHQSASSITADDPPWDDTDGPDLDLGTGVPIEAPSGPGEPDNSTDDGTITDGPALLFKIQQMTSKTACTANDLLALLGLQSLRDIKPVVGYDEAYAAALVKWGPRGS